MPEGLMARRRRPRKSERQEALCKLEVGECFYLPTTAAAAGQLLWWSEAKFPDREFATEEENGGVRIWRTK